MRKTKVVIFFKITHYTAKMEVIEKILEIKIQHISFLAMNLRIGNGTLLGYKSVRNIGLNIVLLPNFLLTLPQLFCKGDLNFF